MSVVLPLSLYHVENRVFLSCGVQVTGAAWRPATRIMAEVGDLLQRTEVGQAQVKYSVAGQSRGRVTLCVICTVHKKARSANFLVELQNEGRWFGLKTTGMVCQWFGLKTTWIVSPGLASKSVALVSPGLASKPVEGFPVWASKPATSIW
jgi:hypothetical protein